MIIYKREILFVKEAEVNKVLTELVSIGLEIIVVYLIVIKPIKVVVDLFIGAFQDLFIGAFHV